MSFPGFSDLRRYMRVLMLVNAVVISTWPTRPLLAADSSEPGIIGQWRLTAAIDFAEVASLDEREAKRMVGNTLTISRKQLRLGKEVCPSPNFASQRVEPRLYLDKHYRASAAKLGLPNPVTVVHLNCTAAFIKNRDHLVIFWDGWFFDAVRTKH